MVITVLQESGVGSTRIETEEKQKKTLLELLREKQIYVDAPCNGRGNCGKCLVQYQSGAPEPTEREKKKLTEAQCSDGWRLACLSVPQVDCEVRLRMQKQENMAVETGFSHENRKNVEVRTTPLQDIERKGRKETQNDGVNDFGVALDIGTTTLAASLLRLSTGETCQNAVSVNHQRAYGADVISRIRAANEGKASPLQNCIREDILLLLQKLAAQEQIGREQIKHLVITGNTTMCHLLLGYSCENLGKAPFSPVDISLQKRTWKQVFENEEYGAEVTILPGISAFVGADIAAGIYSTNLCDESCTMLLDIGTNGEMALYAKGHLFVTSVAAGPALEGGNISCGMPGIMGAVSHAALFGRNRMVVKTIGNGKPEGLCGTGIIDVVYELVKHRLVDENGTLQPEFFEKGYPVVKDSIYFTQEDIRQVQMAKAAIHAGIELLLMQAGTEISRVEKVYLAGGFGTAIDVEKAMGIGLLPKEFRGKVVSVGNSALEGAKRCLLEPKAGEEMAELAERAEEINLAMKEAFQETYLGRMQF